MQIVGAIWIAFLLDHKKVASRRTRGFLSVAVVATIVIASWIGLTVWLYRHPMDLTDQPLFDWTEGPFGGFFVLNLLFGMIMVVVSRWPYRSSPLTMLTKLSSIKLRCNG